MKMKHLTREFFAEHFPEFEILERQGTYLLWISYEKLGITEEELENGILENANDSCFIWEVFLETRAEALSV